MDKSINDIKKRKRGRPKLDNQQVLLRITPELSGAIDDWRSKQDDEPKRPEAIRRLVELGLKK